jgi:hypothetical protein
VDLVLAVEDEEAVTGAALQALAGDSGLSGAERADAERAVAEDTAEALACLVDPFDLVGEMPGVELQQASWSSELIDHVPGSPVWDLDEDDGEDEGEGDDGQDETDESGEYGVREGVDRSYGPERGRTAAG